MGHLVSRMDSGSASECQRLKTPSPSSSSSSSSSSFSSSSCATPSAVPERLKPLALDPRSPSGIPRTPILFEESNTTSIRKKKIVTTSMDNEKKGGWKDEVPDANVDDEVFKSNDLDMNKKEDVPTTPQASIALHKRMRGLVLDPRSPSAQPRTPIIVDEEEEKKKKNRDGEKAFTDIPDAEESNKENLANLAVTIKPSSPSPMVVVETESDKNGHKEINEDAFQDGNEERSFVI